MCGKSLYLGNVRKLSEGSPPRVREKLGVDCVVLIAPGITPACAGKALKDPNEIKTFLSF